MYVAVPSRIQATSFTIPNIFKYMTHEPGVMGLHYKYFTQTTLHSQVTTVYLQL